MNLSRKVAVAAVGAAAAILPVAISSAGTSDAPEPVAATPSRTPGSAPATASPSPSTSPSMSPAPSKKATTRMAGAPYLYPGWGDAPDPTEVIEETGVEAITVAFVVAGDGCEPVWTGETGLTGGAHAAAIKAIKRAGAEVIPSIGGWSGDKLGPACSTAAKLAGAYQKVIDTTGAKAIDIDIENADEFQDHDVQDRILGALKIIQRGNPKVRTILTFSTSTTGPNADGQRLIQRAAELDAGVDVFTQMPFNFAAGTDIYAATVSATEGLKDQLTEAFGWTAAEAYAHIGISAMNGVSDHDEVTTVATFKKIRVYAEGRGLARLAVWAVNRDRGCATGEAASDCSGITQQDWAFTREAAEF